MNPRTLGERSMTFREFTSWAFQGLVGLCIMYGVSLIQDLTKSVNDLNKNVAVMVEKNQWHEKILENHAVRLRTLEAKAGVRPELMQ